METVMMTRPVLKKQLNDILLDISWANTKELPKFVI